jgi:hypothetical protein
LRTTFVVTPDGKIAATLSSADDKVTPAQHDEKSLAVVQDLKGRTRPLRADSAAHRRQRQSGVAESQKDDG